MEEGAETEEESTEKAEKEGKGDKARKEGHVAPLGEAEPSEEKGNCAPTARFKPSPGRVREQSQPGRRRV